MVALATLFHFSGSEGQRPWLPPLLPSRRRMGCRPWPLSATSQGQDGRDHGCLHPFLLGQGWGGGHDHLLPLLRTRRTTTMVAFTPSFHERKTMGQRHDRKTMGHRHDREDDQRSCPFTPFFLLEDGCGVAMTTIPYFAEGEWERP